MNLKLTTTITRGDLTLEKDSEYEVDSVVVDSYRIKVPMKQKGKFKFALVRDDEGVLV